MLPVPVRLCGHRALLVGPLKPTSARSSPPPVVLIGGTAQWIDSWSLTGHLTKLAMKRQVCRTYSAANPPIPQPSSNQIDQSVATRFLQVLIYETRGQWGARSTLDLADCSLNRHAADFVNVLRAAKLHENPIDLLGFSFGARLPWLWLPLRMPHASVGCA